MRITLDRTINDLGFRLLSVTARAGSNTFLSPLSVFLALAVLGTATRGVTQEEVARGLGLDPRDIDAAAAAVATAVLATLPYSNNGVAQGTGTSAAVVHLAVACWIRHGVPITDVCQMALATVYHADLASVDFGDPRLPHVVNEWVRRQTAGEITQVVDRFDPLSIFCLASVLSLQALWISPFDRSATHESDFFGHDGQALAVPMMEHQGRFAYVEHEDFQAIRLPLADGSLDLCLVLPHAASSLESVRARLDAMTWTTWLARMWIQRGTLRLPRFAAAYGADPDLIPHMRALGLHRPFDPRRADFSGLCGPRPEEAPPIYASRIIHRTRITVDEEGVSAAAATVVEMRETGAGILTSRQKEFTMVVNRPFLCALRHVHSGVLLFLGGIEVPT